MILTRQGNKKIISQEILKYFPKHNTYIELFFGAGGMFFNKPLSLNNICNDYDNDVYNLWNEVKFNKEKLVIEIETLLIHNKIWEIYKNQKPIDNTLRAALFLMYSNFGYMGRPQSLGYSASCNYKSMIIERIDKTFELLKNVLFTNYDFRNVIEKIKFRTDKEIEWQNSLALPTVSEYNLKYPLMFRGKSVRVGYYTDFYSAGFNNRFVYLYLYDSFSIKASEDSYKALQKSKLFGYGKLDVTDNLFPELKEIGNKVEITNSYDETSQSISIRYEIHIGSMRDIDVNLNAKSRAAQVDKLVHRTLDRVSLSEIINRIIKLLTNMLSAVKSGGEIQNTVEWSTSKTL